MIDSAQNIGNDKFHLSSKKNRPLSQKIKYEVYLNNESNYCSCSCGSLLAKKDCIQTLLYTPRCYQKRNEMFKRCHLSLHMSSIHHLRSG